LVWQSCRGEINLKRRGSLAKMLPIGRKLVDYALLHSGNNPANLCWPARFLT
jgi:hypothetical protein